MLEFEEVEEEEEDDVEATHEHENEIKTIKLEQEPTPLYILVCEEPFGRNATQFQFFKGSKHYNVLSTFE